MKTRIHQLILAALLPLALFGCATTPAGQPASPPNIDAICTATKLAFKYTTKGVLDNNPAYAGEVAALNGAVATLLTGTPTEAAVKAQLLEIAPSLSPADLATYAAALVDAHTLVTQALGTPTLIATNPDVAKVIGAITDGIAAGITLHAAGSS